MTWFAGIDFDLLPDAPDVHGRGRGVAVGIAPDRLEQLLAPERGGRPRRQEHHEVEFACREREQRVTPTYFASTHIDSYVAGDDRIDSALERRDRIGACG